MPLPPFARLGCAIQGAQVQPAPVLGEDIPLAAELRREAVGGGMVAPLGGQPDLQPVQVEMLA